MPYLFKNISKFVLTFVLLLNICLVTCAWASESNCDQSCLILNSKSLDLYMGNKFSLKYHVLNCPYAIVMSKYKRKYFDSQKAAYEAGLRPCRYCLPYKGLCVKASIIDK